MQPLPIFAVHKHTNHCIMNLAQRTELAYAYQAFERNLYGTQHAGPFQVPTITEAQNWLFTIEAYS